jgi:hypothetical protein
MERRGPTGKILAFLFSSYNWEFFVKRYIGLTLLLHEKYFFLKKNYLLAAIF